MSDRATTTADAELSPATLRELKPLVQSAVWFLERSFWIGVSGTVGGIVLGFGIGTAGWALVALVRGGGVPALSTWAPFALAGAAVPPLALAVALGRTARPSFLTESKPTLKPPVLEMVGISAGEFLREDDARVHVSAFEMARTPITEAQWKELFGEGQAAQTPKVEVSWHDAVRFCNELSKRHGYTPCYDGDTCNFAADGYRLPTEAEWEYACRAGTTTRFWWGDDEEGAKDHAWYAANANGPKPVGSANHENAFGLSDMAGNVWEWCNDRHSAYDASNVDNPKGANKGMNRVLRGGSWGSATPVLQSARRRTDDPMNAGDYIGFRCVRVPRPEP